MFVDQSKLILMCLLIAGSWSLCAQDLNVPDIQGVCSNSSELEKTQSLESNVNKNTKTTSQCNNQKLPDNPIDDTNTNNTTQQDGQLEFDTLNSEQTSLIAVEKATEKKRLKVLFVDVNTVVEGVGSTMDWTANVLDGFFAKDEKGKNKAKTWGHFIVGWEPSEGNVVTGDSFPIKFKVKAKLPNLENKVEIILSDGEDDDFKTLPYESVRPEAFKLSQSSLGAAVRFLHTESDNVSTSARIGWGEDQLYTRTSITYRKKFLGDKVTFNIKPSLEFYVVDGWGARILMDTGYKISAKSEVRYNFSLRDLESYDSSEWRSGLFQISAIGDSSALVIGLSSFGYVEPKPKAELHRFSIRYRFNALRSWIYFEFEPFVELRQKVLLEGQVSTPLTSEFERNAGISFRFETHYGFL